MKLLRHTLLTFSAFAALMLSSCVREEFRDPDPAPGTEDDGEHVTLNFSVDMMQDAGQTVWTKSLGEVPQVQDLYVAVFDQGDILTEIVKAEPGTVEDPRDLFEPGSEANKYLTRFHVTLKKTADSREVMFIAIGQKNFIDTGSFDMVDEASFIKKFIVSDNVDAYWCRKHFNGIDENSTSEMQALKMIRNFLKVSVSSVAANFELTGFKVFNKPRYGTLAPYNPNTREYNFDDAGNASVNFDRFADYSKIEGKYEDVNNEAYKELTENQKYVGYMPGTVEYISMYEEVGEEAPDIWFANNLIAPEEFDYLYECTYTTAANPYIIFKGRFTGTGASGNETYYKADFVYQKDEDSDKKYFHLLRNFFYELKITSVQNDGAESLEAAANSPSMNNFDGSTESQSYTVISKTGARMYISSTDIMVTNGTSTKVYLKNLTGADFSTIDNSKITISKISKCINVKDINQVQLVTPLINYSGNYADDMATMEPDDTDFIKNFNISVTNDNATFNGSSGWREYTITLNANPTSFEANEMRRQEITFSDGDGGLTRTLTLSGRKPYDFYIDVQDYVPGNEGETMYVDIIIPSGISEARFPLKFWIESADHTIYPDATSADYPTLPVSSGTSKIAGHTERSYWFTRTITYDEYRVAHEDIQSDKSFRSYFKTLVPASATTIHVLSDTEASNYFAGTKSDSFVNERITGTISFERNPLNISVGAKAINPVTVNSGAPVTYSVENVAVATVNATTGEVIGVTEGETVITATIPQYKAYTAASTQFRVVVVKQLPEWNFTWDRLLIPVVNVGKTVNNSASAVATTMSSTYNQTVTYSSSNTSVATVDANGVVTGVNPGTVTITAHSRIELEDYTPADQHTYSAFEEDIIYILEVVAPGVSPAIGTEYINVPFTDGNMMWFTKTWEYQDAWNFRDDGLEYGIQAEGENALGKKVNSHSWLISPVLDLRAAVNPVLKFNHTGNKWTDGYTGDGVYGELGVEYVPKISESNLSLARERMKEDAKVKISFDGGETWSDDTILSLEEYPDGRSWNSLDVSHSLKTLLEGKSETQLQNVRIAFEYKAESQTRPTDPSLYRPWTGCWQMKLFRIVEEAE